MKHESEINYCYNTGEISSRAERWVSGIASSVTRGSKINNCYNSGKITIENEHKKEYNYRVGGIASNTYYDSSYGEKICEIKNCYNMGEIIYKSYEGGYNISVGGILGDIQNGYTNLNNNYNKGNISAIITDINLGGIIGKIVKDFPQITVTNCATTTENSIGTNETTANDVTITNVTSNQTQMPNILDVINIGTEEVFVKDEKNINQSNPILKWQIENEENK